MKKNNNENEQFNLFSQMLEITKNEKNNLFYKHKKIEMVAEEDSPYDAIVTLQNKSTLYVQLTTMNNVFALKNGQKIDPSRKNLFISPKAINNQKHLSKIQKNLRNEGIEREYFANEPTKVYYRDKFKTILPNEEDLDEKYKIRTEHLINAVYRSLFSKLNKYPLSKKQKNSILVIIDYSSNEFHKAPVVNPWYIKTFNIKEINQLDFFISILCAAKNEILSNRFIDNIQIYFKVFDNSIKEYFFCIVHDKMINNFPLPKYSQSISQIRPVTMKNTNRGSILIDTKKD